MRGLRPARWVRRRAYTRRMAMSKHHPIRLHAGQSLSRTQSRAILLMAMWLLRPAFGQAAPPGSYECDVDMAVGFYWGESSRSWTPKVFRSMRTYVVRALPERDKFGNPPRSPWGVFDDDGDVPVLPCPELPRDRSRLICGGIGLGFVLNPEALRFQHNYLGGYVAGRDNNDDTPMVESGRCRLVR